MLRAAGKKLYFVTNNSTKSRKGYLSKCAGRGGAGREALHLLGETPTVPKELSNSFTVHGLTSE